MTIQQKASTIVIRITIPTEFGHKFTNIVCHSPNLEEQDNLYNSANIDTIPKYGTLIVPAYNDAHLKVHEPLSICLY